ncbi:MAG: thiopurine S-methyltransferase [Gammaproteobacteria bacterium]|nr:MAG: thiopurine S-methyltransferase [Gammaproteobacteria bacterium]
MKADFWHDRWENNLTGFHLNEVNPHLIANWDVLKLKAGARVFVPLCGKTLDLIWLAEQGYEVVGIELSPLAVEAFFAENNLKAEQHQLDGLEYWQSGNITLFCGDFFDLTAEILGQVDAAYDRASLIALPPAMRQEYAAKMTELTQSAPKLLVTLEYDQSKMTGPPFSVSEEEVKALYQAKYQVKQLSAQDVLGDNERFRQKGLESLNECIYILETIR